MATAPAGPGPQVQQPMYDTLLRGGTVYDAANGIAGELRDVAISGGKIAAVCRPGELAESAAAECVDCTGLLVVPGLVDLHAHGFAGMGPVGIDFDTYCVSRGTTTVVPQMLARPARARLTGSGGTSSTRARPGCWRSSTSR